MFGHLLLAAIAMEHEKVQMGFHHKEGRLKSSTRGGRHYV